MEGFRSKGLLRPQVEVCIEIGVLAFVVVCFHCCNKTVTKRNLGRKGYIGLTHPDHSLPCRKPGLELKVGT